MPLVSITRLRVRSWRYFPAFFVATVRSALQARRARGNLAISVFREAHNTFWTCSLWIDEAAMKFLHDVRRAPHDHAEAARVVR